MSIDQFPYLKPDPGKLDEAFCDLCRTQMDVTRNVCGPTSWGASMAGINHLHDVFKCPHREKKWHKQAVRIKIAASEHPSKRISDIMLSEMDEIIQNKSPTKGAGDD